MQIDECFYSGLKEMWNNKVRSCLSVLGIIIGIIALIAMLAIMAGIEQQWKETVEMVGGFKKATITSVNPVKNGIDREDLKKPLTVEDVYAVKRSELVRYASPTSTSFSRVSKAGENRDYMAVTGAMRDIFPILKKEIKSGRPITDEDVEKSKNVAVIGEGVRSKYFGRHESPIGHELEIDGQAFDIIGLLDPGEEGKQNKRRSFRDPTKVIFIPVTVMLNKMAGENNIREINYVIYREKDMDAAKREIKKRISQNHHHVDDIEITGAKEMYLKARKKSQAFRISVSLIAGISLVVGGIGIMNVMIASVAQRVKEIGVRKSVGAKPIHILVQFLVESVLISGLGGIIGIGGSFGIVAIMQKTMAGMSPIITPSSVILSASFSIVVGITFGLYPAIKASKLDPIEALRYQ